MEIRYYKCEFKSDVILNASSNTQGNIELLDFIPGSAFLGMVASGKNYDEFADDAFVVFHSGKVKFCDGNICINKKQSYKRPLSFHNLKLQSDTYFNKVHLSEEEEQKLRDERKQLKQIRTGYMNEDFECLTPKYSYTQKSAYDKTHRRSADEKMYGYSALQKGTSWIFKVVYEDEKLIDKIESKLLKDKRLGKSKTVQYGRVHISKETDIKEIGTFTPNKNIIYLYVNSRLVLMDEDGNFTQEPSIENLGLESGEIDWEKTQIKTTNYSPYNFARKCHEYTRDCIKKGSVIVVKNFQGDVKDIKTFVGAFQSEGFGELIVNPKFLEEKNPKLTNFQIKKDMKTSDLKDNLVSYLKYRKNLDDSRIKVAKHVSEVYKEFKRPSKSQWGQIRSFATSAESEVELINKIREFTQHGVEKKQWEKKLTLLESEIKKSTDWREFIKLLSMIVSKHTKGGKNE